MQQPQSSPVSSLPGLLFLDAEQFSSNAFGLIVDSLLLMLLMLMTPIIICNITLSWSQFVNNIRRIKNSL